MAQRMLQDEEEIRQYLAMHNIPKFIDDFVQLLVKEQPDDYKPLLTHMLASQVRAKGKGAKALEAAAEQQAKDPGPQKALKYSGGGGGFDEAPAYCKRDPRVKPTETQIKGNGVVTWPETRSVIEMPEKRADYATTVIAQYKFAVAQCTAVCEQIAKKCQAERKPFFDDSFWYGKRNTMYPKGAPADCTVTEPLQCMRACEVYAKAPMFDAGVDSNDIVQGAVGDCFFIGAVSALASSSATELKALERLFAYFNIEWGIYGVCWFKNGEWEWVIVDDWIAVQQTRSGKAVPQYACPGGANPELWPLIIEKAYAKIHFCWDSIDGGWGREALEDLTGGLGYTLDLFRKDKKEYGGDCAKFFDLVNNRLTILGCAVGQHVADAGGAGRAGESGAVFGLFKGHAYSLIKAVKTSDGQGFLRVRNPWGNEAEWKGAYADNSPEWNRNPLHKRELNPVFKDDGAFWMKWEDFKTIFTDIDVVKFFDDQSVSLNMYGAAPREDNQPNHTYILQIQQKQPVDMIASIGQTDPKTQLDHNVRKTGRYAVMHLSIKRLTELPSKFADLPNCLGQKFETERAANRTLFYPMTMTEGYYCIAPKFSNASGVGYYIRVFAPPNSKVRIWRFSDGEAKAISVDAGKATAEAVISGGGTLAPTNSFHVPSTATTTDGGKPTPRPQPTPAPAPTPAASGSGGAGPAVKPTTTTSGEVHSRLGLATPADLQTLIKRSFDEEDPYQRGKLDQNRIQGALQRVLFGCPKFTASFDKAWAKAETTGSAYARITFDAFKKLAQDVLTDVFQ